jgi:hypothetical protein
MKGLKGSKGGESGGQCWSDMVKTRLSADVQCMARLSAANVLWYNKLACEGGIAKT